MARWNGFSEEDITKVNSLSDTIDGCSGAKCRGGHILHTDKTERGLKNTCASMKKRGNNVLPSNGRGPPNMQETSNVDSIVVSKLKQSEAEAELSLGTKQSQDVEFQKVSENCTGSSKVLKQSEVMNHHAKSLTAKLVMPSLCQPPPSSINLSDFETKHKLMEEQNRARRVLLAKALEDRKKQTQAEQHRLGLLQEELRKLDQRLSSDVSIIRNQIETASFEFMEAQKRYDRAEKEFLDAKLLLYTKLERKDLLTQHLCAIIEQNEMRKAKKLSELMEKLQMPDTETPQTVNNQTDLSIQKETNSNISSEVILSPTSVISGTDMRGN